MVLDSSVLISAFLTPRGASATAVAARADLLVTGDRHLLDLERHAAIRIIDPRRFLGELARTDPSTG